MMEIGNVICKSKVFIVTIVHALCYRGLTKIVYSAISLLVIVVIAIIFTVISDQ